MELIEVIPFITHVAGQTLFPKLGHVVTRWVNQT